MIKYTNYTQPHAGLLLSQLGFFSRGKVVVNVFIKLIFRWLNCEQWISLVTWNRDFEVGEQPHPVVSVVMS